MAKNTDKVMEFVRKELQRNPDVATRDLHERAKKVDSGVESLSLRQFNARFPLQLKRRQGSTTRKRPAKSAARRRSPRSAQGRSAQGRSAQGRAAQGRDGVREAFLRFAEELTAAEERKDFVRVLARVDGYVDDAIKAAGKG